MSEARKGAGVVCVHVCTCLTVYNLVPVCVDWCVRMSVYVHVCMFVCICVSISTKILPYNIAYRYISNDGVIFCSYAVYFLFIF